MMKETRTERQAWQDTTELLENHNYIFGPHWSFNFRNDPKRLAFVLSRYKFAAKMIGVRNHVLELGCSDGIGTSIIAEKVNSYTGIDLDREALEAAKTNFPDSKYQFFYDDFLGKTYGAFDAIISLDVIEHIIPEFEPLYFETIMQNLSENGIVVIGTPNITASAYASKASQLGHVNLYSQERLVNELKNRFHQVFPFGMNDETMHTGFGAMAHYLICIACHKKN